MKSICHLFMLILLLYACCITSCSNNKRDTLNSETTHAIETRNAEMEALIQKLNQNCIYFGGQFQNVTGYDFEDNSLIINVAVNPNFINIANIKRHKDIEKKEIIEKLKYSIWKGNDSMATAFRYLVDNDIYAEIRFADSKENNYTCSIYLSTDELKEIVNIQEDPTRTVLNAQIESFNIQMPLQVDYCTIMKKLSISDGYLTYDYEIIESEVPINYFIGNKSLVEESLRQKLFAQANDELMHQAKREGLGYRYRYEGDTSHKKFSVTFSNSELK